MKKLVTTIFALAAAITFSFNASAQTANSDISASAVILDEIKVSKLADLTFGQVMVNTKKTVEITGVASSNGNASSSEGAAVGSFIVNAGAGADVQLSFTALPATLAGPNSATLPISYTENQAGDATNLVAYGNNLDASGATRFTAASGTQVASGLFPTNAINSSKGIYVFVGGTVNAAADQARGTYSGTVTLKAEYN